MAEAHYVKLSVGKLLSTTLPNKSHCQCLFFWLCRQSQCRWRLSLQNVKHAYLFS